MKERQLWVKFENKDQFLKEEAKVFDILCNNTGDMEVKFYFVNPKAVKHLYKLANDEAAAELIELLGEDNVRIQEIQKIKPEPERYPLDRIADSLEGMEVDLERIADALEALASCTFNTMYGDAFHICGSVSRD